MSTLFNFKVLVVGFALVGLQLSAASSLASGSDGSVEALGSSTVTPNTETESVLNTAANDTVDNVNTHVVYDYHVIMLLLMAVGISGGLLVVAGCYMIFMYSCCCDRCRRAAEASRNGNRAQRPRVPVHPIRRLYDIELSQRP